MAAVASTTPSQFTFAPTTAESAAFDRPDELTSAELAALRAPTVPAGVDSTTFHLAYGARGIPKLIEGLSSSTPLFRKQQSLCFLSDLFHRPENVSQGLEEGIVGILARLLRVDVTVRQKASECLKIISGHAVGRAGIVQANVLEILSRRVSYFFSKQTERFTDSDDLVRRNIHQTLSQLTLDQPGAAAVLSTSGLLPALIGALPFERALDVQVPILSACYNCIRRGAPPHVPDVPIECGAMNVFTKMLKVGCSSDVLVGVAKCIMALSEYHQGKRLAVENNTIEVLIPLLRHRRSEVRAAVAAALMSITIDVEAKRLVVRSGDALPILMSLLRDRSDTLLVNVVKTLTNCAEDYRGRFQLHQCLKQLQTLYDSPNPQLAQAARRAVEVITWRP
ncbi:armadillo-type protein [Fimicolochytrium jonesii]|uniref:armadillo-type protein n=1 Tax=Fimicolochytrium jonesii TaxID=1396493 RepID=UPI0022FE3CE6|nr:armadillo-type protein [Fimicolochytrium jonesii]KAI8816087.1 armadillo-type protein [Fimicolochytrium jonesii]